MPPADVILTALSRTANDWLALAIAWHVLLGAMVGALFSGWRPPHRSGGMLLATPVVSVSALAWSSGNPFNGIMFAALGVAMVSLARRLEPQPVRIAPSLPLVAGSLAIAFAWCYPHFLRAETWAVFLYAAPLGLVPCPTLAAVIGMTMVLGIYRSMSWTLVLIAWGLLYGGMGVYGLGVDLDYGLLGATTLLACCAFGARRTWRPLLIQVPNAC